MPPLIAVTCAKYNQIKKDVIQSVAGNTATEKSF